MAKDFELREQAEELFVIDGLSLEQVSKATGVIERTLSNWSTEGGWKGLRAEYREAIRGIRRYTVLTKLKLIKDAMTTLDPQKIYAFAALERAVKGGSEEESIPASDAETREIRTAEDAVEALEDAVKQKLNMMLSRPNVISLAGIRDMKKALELIEQMQTKYAVEPEKAKIEGNDEDQARFWREKVLQGR